MTYKTLKDLAPLLTPWVLVCNHVGLLPALGVLLLLQGLCPLLTNLSSHFLLVNLMF